MYAFGSKYALALYELIAKRINLKHKTNEAIPLDRFRALLGVEPDKLREFKNLKSRAIDPSVLEVNALCGDFSCAVEPVYQGRKVTAVKLSWREKTAEERKAAWRELNGSKIGRNARPTGTVEQADTLPELPTPEKPKQTAADDRLKNMPKRQAFTSHGFLTRRGQN